MPKVSARFSSLPWKSIALGVLVCVGIGLLYQGVDLETVRDYADRLNGGVAFLLLTVLPLFGFPVTPLHVVMGIRFGTGLGLLLVGCSILLQLLASYTLVHFFRDKFARHLETIRRKIPRAAHPATCLFTMLLPGVPYFAKNYVLPLIGVPLRTYLLICLPIHVARSAVAVFFGDESDHLTPTRIAWLAVYFSITLGTSYWMFRRIRSHMGHPSRSKASTDTKGHSTSRNGRRFSWSRAHSHRS